MATRASCDFGRIVIGMGMMRTWIAGAILGLCCVVRADDVLTRVEAWLSAGIEPAGVHEQLRALGSAGEEALWTLYADARKSRVVRLRALGELAGFPSARTAGGLAAIVRAAPSSQDTLARSPLVLRRALDGLSAIGETLPLGIEASELSFVASHPDAHVRKAAAKLLATVEHADVQLSALATRDPSRMVRASAQRSQTMRAQRR
ncbi:MAG TPA: hypothetical protein VFX59_13645 [Polyangiales bacterium]|nr:hypothetical protein [Polyangiales bacterium]